MAEDLKVTLTTGVGIVSFPRVFASTAGKNDKGETVYDIQFLIPKTQREDAKAISAAIREVGEAKWGANWKKFRTPLRDGDAEKDELTEDGSTKGDKYPERLGHYFFNAKSYKPVGVFDRQKNLITEPTELYGGCKAKLAVVFYTYARSGNQGIGVGLNGVQKVADGEPLGGGAPSVDSMFDLIDEDDLDGIDGEVEEKPKKKSKKSKK